MRHGYLLQNIVFNTMISSVRMYISFNNQTNKQKIIIQNYKSIYNIPDKLCNKTYSLGSCADRMFI